MSPTHPNALLIERFYLAFQKLDAEIMVSCYAEEVRFSDPVFPDLNGDEVGKMWRMLCARAQNFSLSFDSVEADEHIGRGHWVARYTFSQTGREVLNDIHAEFRFADGKIVSHKDSFSLWKWAGQALGLKGWLLGWSGIVQNKIRAQARRGLSVSK